MEDMLKELMERYPELGSTKSEIINARNMVINTLEKGGKVLLCGNGEAPPTAIIFQVNC